MNGYCGEPKDQFGAMVNARITLARGWVVVVVLLVVVVVVVPRVVVVAVAGQRPATLVNTVSCAPPPPFPVHTANAVFPPIATPLYSPMRNVETVSAS